MISGVFVYRILLKSPLADTPQVDCYALLIIKLGMEIIALMLHYGFDYATIVTYSAIGLCEICFYILSPFVLFSTHF